jgi:hypothetical protein
LNACPKPRKEKDYKIPNRVNNWLSQNWYSTTVAKPSNQELYGKYKNDAEEILFEDSPEESVIVEFVNTGKKMLNFIASEKSIAFLNMERT